MNNQRRDFIRLTAAGLIYVAANPFELEANDRGYRELLVRKATERGHSDLGWLDSYHTFSFGGYYDQRHMGFRSLRVINDDRIAAGRGFPTHPHRNMEILSYVLKGALQHRDSTTGQGAIVRPGDVQMMSAGTGITHSEYNPSRVESNHFLQIWIRPAQKGSRPTYQQQRVTAQQKENGWQLIAAPNSDRAVVSIQQDARILATLLDSSAQLEYVVEHGRNVWLHVAKGKLIVNGTTLATGDAIATSRPTHLNLEGIMKSEVLLFDLG